MKNTLDILHVTFDKSPADETVISVAKVVNGKIYVLKMELGEQAELLYHLLTEKTAKVEIAESKEQDTISRQEVLSKIKEVCFSEEWEQFRVDNGSNGQRDFLINYIEQLSSVSSLEKPNKCEDAISRQMVLDATVNKNSIWNNITNAKGENLEKIILQLPSVDQLNKWIGAEVIDEIRYEIEHMIPCSKEALSIKLGVLQIIDKYMAESEEDENDKDN